MAAQGPSLQMNQRLELTVASGDALDVRHFHVNERISSIFEISLVARSDNDDIDFEAVVGQEARFTVRAGALPHQERTWTGVVSQLQQVAVEDQGLSTYHLTLVPPLWFLTQRRNHRMFQQKSELDIVLQILGEWNIQPEQRLSGTYKKRKYRVQYAESDYTFICRMLEDAGISFYFETESGGETKLVLHDAPQSNTLRQPPIAFRDRPTDADMEHVTEVRIGRKIRPGKYTVRDHDYRRPPSYKLMASATNASGVEEKLERYHYAPGAFLFESDKGESTPNADDKGKYRTDEGEANALAQKRLQAKRAVAKSVTFDTNVVDMAPGVVMSFVDHPKSDLGAGKRFLILGAALGGQHDGQWTATCEAIGADSPYRPALSTPKPKVIGVESATVVGPAGEEIHTDEFGRVRVHFHWDRESKMDDGSSCWIHVSQPWGGAGFGGSNLPRIGQEVLVDFLGGDPDRPIIVGRVYTNLQKTPYKLPDNKTQSGWQSRSSPGGGGDNFNELMFEDKKGQELLRMQAEKDLKKLVKNDEAVNIGRDRAKEVGRDDRHTVGRNRTKLVKNNEDNTIGNNRSTLVKNNDREVIGQNQNLVVGVNRSTQVGAIDSTVVGSTHVTSISPPGEGGGESTSQVMVHDKITFSTPGGAMVELRNNVVEIKGTFIILSGDHIYINAKEFAGMTSQDRTRVAAGSSLELEGKTVDAKATGGDFVVKGGPKIKLNP